MTYTGYDTIAINALIWMGALSLVIMPVIVAVAIKSFRWAFAMLVALITTLILISTASAFDPDWCNDTGCCWFFEQHWVDENQAKVYFTPAIDDRMATDGMCEFFAECMLDLTEQGYTVHKVGERWAPSAYWPITHKVAVLLSSDWQTIQTGTNAEWRALRYGK